MGWDDTERSSPLAITVQHRPGAVVLHLVGEVDDYTSKQLAAAVQTGLAQAADLLVLDLTEVSFFGSRGIAELISTAQDAARAGKTARVVVGHNRHVRRPLEIIGVAANLALFVSLDHALTGRDDHGTADHRKQRHS